MLGCGHCEYCLAGHQHVCPDRFEVGIRDGWAGALAEQVLIPTRFAYEIPEHVSVTAAALVEPGGNSLRAVRAANIEPGHRVLVLGSGTIGLLAAQFALAAGAEVHVGGVREGSLALARSLGVPHTWQLDELVAAEASDHSTPSSKPPATKRCPRCRSGSRSPPVASSTSGCRRPRASSTRATSPQGHHRGRHPLGVTRTRRRDRELRRRRGGARRDRERGRRARRGARPTRGATRRRRRAGAEGPRGPATPARVRSGRSMNDEPTHADATERDGRLVGADRVIAVLTELAEHPLGITLDELAGIVCRARSPPCTARWPRCDARASPTWPGAASTSSETSTCGSRSGTSTAAPRRPHPAAARAAGGHLRRDRALRRPLGQRHRLPREDGPAAGRGPPHLGHRWTQSRLPDRGRQGAAQRSAPRRSTGVRRLVRRVPARAEDRRTPWSPPTPCSTISRPPVGAASASTTRRTRSASTASRSRSTSTVPPPRQARSASAPSPSAARWSVSSTRCRRSARRSSATWVRTRSASAADSTGATCRREEYRWRSHRPLKSCEPRSPKPPPRPGMSRTSSWLGSMSPSGRCA